MNQEVLAVAREIVRKVVVYWENGVGNIRAHVSSEVLGRDGFQRGANRWNRDTSKTFEVVAGAGFEPATFRL
jgi:hypothetical protein